MSDDIEKLKSEVRGVQRSQEMLFGMVEVVEDDIKTDMNERFDRLDVMVQNLIDDQKALGRRVQDLGEATNGS